MSKAKRIHAKATKITQKVWLLYLFLFLAFLSVAKALFSSDYSGFILSGIGFLILAGSTALAQRGLTQRLAYEQATLAKAPAVPYMSLAAIGLGIGSFYLNFFVGGRTLLPSLFAGILAPAGFWLYYGFDPKKDKLGAIEGISADLVLETLHEAKEKLSHIREDITQIHDRTLQQKITIATQKADTILATIQEDPKDIRVARKFLIVYIDGIAKVTSSYRQLDEEEITIETKEKLYTLMDDIESRFSSELTRLKENNQFDLDVHIDVLKEQIKN